VFPQPNDLIGPWTGFIVHHAGSMGVQVKIDKIQADGSLHGTYSFPAAPTEPGGEFTAELYGPELFVRLTYGVSHGKLHFHLHLLGENGPQMMYGAIPPKEHGVPHATVTVFPGQSPVTITGAWQIFSTEGL
jgi:hypothetical protein